MLPPVPSGGKLGYRLHERDWKRGLQSSFGRRLYFPWTGEGAGPSSLGVVEGHQYSVMPHVSPTRASLEERLVPGDPVSCCNAHTDHLPSLRGAKQEFAFPNKLRIPAGGSAACLEP